jgi:hypothetical protein
MTRLGEHIREAPATLWIFAFLMILWGLVAIVLISGWAAWVTLIFDGVVAVLILNRVRLAWMLLVAGATIGAVTSPFTSAHWWLAFPYVLLLALLLLPPSRRYMATNPASGKE